MKRSNGQLVCEYLENISRSALEKYQEIVKHYTRRRRGIYALYRGDKLYYVGLATNLRSRLKQHLRDRHGKSWNSFSVYLAIEDNHLKELESLVLRIVKPSGNVQKGHFRKATDLKRRFRRDISNSLKVELNSLFVGGGRERLEKPTRKSGDGKTPVLVGMFDRMTKLRAELKGKTYKALVRKNGSIRFKGKIYNSPSMAAHRITKRAMNGWTFWDYERAPGEWIKLDELRK